MRRMLDENPTHDMFEMFDDHVFGSEEEIKIFIGREDVDQLLHGEWLSTSVLEVFITGLKTMHNRHLDSVGFMCSHLISSTTINSKQEVRCRKYMIDALIKYKGKRLILCPYHDRTSSKFVNSPVKEHMSSAFLGYQQMESKRKAKPPLKWIVAKCPQQKGSTECGYFVMRYMLDIILQHRDFQELKDVFGRTTPYTEDELNEVLDIWASPFMSFLCCAMN
ncbi:uncharacterized protein [Euphorbia lathyris]|uniref:uncharacterized protein isoform X2 n=1 Tax=Euphorbia lathyris TaxID=212925 RepID=UPI0033138053